MIAVILARGLGTRMRAELESANLDEAQRSTADTGVKGMIPTGRPFLDYSLCALADAGISEVCLVIGPEHQSVRDYYTGPGQPRRVDLIFAIQPEPLGTASAVLAAKDYVSDRHFLVLNSDNYYPASALAKLSQATAPAIAAFEADSLVKLGNVPAERVHRFGSLEFTPGEQLTRIVGDSARAKHSGGGKIYCSMNCWSFTPRIFNACEAVPKSARGEFELTQAVQLAMDSMDYRIRVVRMREGVLDLTTRSDIASVQQRLEETGCDP